MRVSILLALLPLAACDPAGSQYGQPETVAGSASAAAIASANCQAEVYQYLIGGPIEAAQLIQYTGTVRVLGPDDFVTRDYDPSRLTVTTLPGDIVGRVFCG